MKQVVLVLCLCMTIFISAQQQTGIHFETDSFATLLTKARQENKIVFVDAYTSWCKPCKWMDANVFPNDTVGAFYNQHYINVRIDMEKGEGIEIAKRYEVGCYPTFLFIDGSGNLIHRASGAYGKSQFITVAETALDSVNQFAYWQRKYESGTATAAQFIRYMNMRSSACLPTQELITDYEYRQRDEDMANRDNWKILYQLINRTDSRLFQHILSHRQEFDAQYTPDSVDQVIDHIYTNAMMNCLWQKEPDTIGYKAIKDTVARLNMPIGKRIIARGDMELYYIRSDWSQYAKTTLAYMEVYGANESYNFLNNCAWFFFLHVEDTNHLETALSWVRLSVAKQPRYFNTDTYASLLYKLGNYKEARTWANISIMLGKEEQANYTETENLLEKIDAGMGK